MEREHSCKTDRAEDGIRRPSDASRLLLIFTDLSALDEISIQTNSTLFICFDHDCYETLRDQGHTVRWPQEYPVAMLASYAELYESYGNQSDEHDHDEPSNSRLDDASMDSDTRTAFNLLRHKASEVIAPIRYIWEIAKTVLTAEQPHAIDVRVQDEWLAAVLTAFLQDNPRFRGITRG